MAQLGALVGGVLLNMLMGLLTEKFLKKLIISALQYIVSKTETDVDNQLLKAAEEAWNNDKPAVDKPE